MNLKFPKLIAIILFVLTSFVLSGCAKDVLLIPNTYVEGETFYLPLQSNITSNPIGDGTTYLYLDASGTDNRIYYDFVGDEKP